MDIGRWRRRREGVGRLEVEAAVRASLATLIPLLALFAVDRLELAIYASFGAFTALYGRSEPYRVRLSTLLVAAAGLTLTGTAGTLLSAFDAPLGVVAVVLTAVVAAALALSEVMNWIPRGAIFFVFVFLGLQSVPVDPDGLAEPLLVLGGSAVLSVLIGMSGALVRRFAPRPVQHRMPPLHRRPVRRLSPVQTRTYWYLAAVNVVGIVTAWGLTTAVGMARPYWAAVAVAAVMPTLASLTGYARMLQRLIGTTIGVLVAAALFGWNPPGLVMVVLIAACAFVTELLVARDYGLALLFITPLALGAVNLGRGVAWGPLFVDRVVETAVGAAVAFVLIAVARAVVRREDRAR